VTRSRSFIPCAQFDLIPPVLAFIDESGCPGFKFTRGSDPIFGIGMVIFRDGKAAAATQAAIARIRERQQHKTEFKFSKSSDAMRDAFFRGIASCPFQVRALVVRKDVLYSPHLRGNTDGFYNYFAKSLMAHDGGELAAARVRIDGSGSRQFQRALGSYLRRELGDRIGDVRLSDSKADPLMQLADMCIGAITRAERDRRKATRWKDILRPRIADIWHFG
jgi:Protein of unknown function (DUF3800)